MDETHQGYLFPLVTGENIFSYWINKIGRRNTKIVSRFV